MTTFFKKLFFSLVFVSLALAFQPSEASARGQSEVGSSRTDSAKARKAVVGGKVVVLPKKLTTKAEIMDFQRDQGLKVDGIVGRQTRRALADVNRKTALWVSGRLKTKADVVAFQRENGLKADGIVGRQTLRVLEAEERKSRVVLEEKKIPLPPFVPDLNAEINQDVPPVLEGGMRFLPSRFGQVSLSEVDGGGSGRKFIVNLNGQPFLTVGGQPSVIGLSKVYSVGDMDAIIITAYGAQNSPVCLYKHYAMVLNSGGAILHDIDNCTRSYSARVVKDHSLFISFPERDGNRAFESIWRLDSSGLNRL